MKDPALFSVGFLLAGLLILWGVTANAIVAGGTAALIAQGIFAIGRRAGLEERK